MNREGLVASNPVPCKASCRVHLDRSAPTNTGLGYCNNTCVWWGTLPWLPWHVQGCKMKASLTVWSICISNGCVSQHGGLFVCIQLLGIFRFNVWLSRHVMEMQAVGLCNDIRQSTSCQHSCDKHNLTHLISIWQNLLHKLLFDDRCMGQVNLIELHNQTKCASARCILQSL